MIYQLFPIRNELFIFSQHSYSAEFLTVKDLWFVFVHEKSFLSVFIFFQRVHQEYSQKYLTSV